MANTSPFTSYGGILARLVARHRDKEKKNDENTIEAEVANAVPADSKVTAGANNINSSISTGNDKNKLDSVPKNSVEVSEQVEDTAQTEDSKQKEDGAGITASLKVAKVIPKKISGNETRKPFASVFLSAAQEARATMLAEKGDNSGMFSHGQVIAMLSKVRLGP